jgi:hypothetical protein
MVLFLSLVAMVREIPAAELDVFVTGESVLTDNATGARDERRNDMLNVIGLEASLIEERENLEANLSLDLEHERYQRDSFSDTTSLNSGVGVLNLDLVESLMIWETAFNRSQVIRDIGSENTLDNRDYRDLLRTGPLLTIDLSETSDLRLRSLYVNVENSDDAVSDSERVNTELSLLHQYNSVMRFDLSVDNETLIEEDELQRYDRYNVSIGILRLLPEGSLSFRVGKSRLEPENEDRIDSNFYELIFSNDEFLYHLLELSFTQDVSDTSIRFDDAVLIEEQAGLLPVNDYITRKQLSASLSRGFDTQNYYVNLRAWNSTYELTDRSEDVFSAEVGYGRDIVAHFSLVLSHRFYHQEYDMGGQDRQEQTFNYRVSANYRFSELLSLSSYLNYFKRQSADSPGREYEEAQLGLTISYQIY